LQKQRRIIGSFSAVPCVRDAKLARKSQEGLGSSGLSDDRSKRFTDDLSSLPDEALSELGPLLAKAQNALQQVLKAQRVYIGRYGHTPGYSIHFHVIPIYDWVETLFWQDARYRKLKSFGADRGEAATDGAELTLFVWREFCERPVPPAIKGPSVSQVIEMLRPIL